MGITDFLDWQRWWSLRTFGPGDRRDGLIKHIKSEIEELGGGGDVLEEWVDIVLLALDGAWRSGHSPKQVERMMIEKQRLNMTRKWSKVANDEASYHDEWT